MTGPESYKVDKVFLRQLGFFLRIRAGRSEGDEAGVDRRRWFATPADNSEAGLGVERGSRLGEGRA